MRMLSLLAVLSVGLGSLGVRGAETPTSGSLSSPSRDATRAASVDVFPPLDPTKLRGRFLHITDLHVDPHYVNGSAQRNQCHRGRPFGGDRAAGFFGHPVSSCDSPVSLINATFEFLRDEIAGKIDFVLLTGDSARHDTDSSIDRPLSEVAELNLMIGSKMFDTFAPLGIPVIFTIGNNDVAIHNTQKPGPSAVLDVLHDAWHSFLPPAEHELFLSEGYFAREVVKDHLVVISLNTMWFFVSNGAVKGCRKRHDVGTRHLNWLIKRLTVYRRAGMQVHIIGHVPPTPTHWYSHCYNRYQRIVLNYQDTIVGQSFGHANVDYISLLVHDRHARKRVRSLALAPEDLRSQYQSVGSHRHTDEGHFSIVNVVPSVVPTYYPSMRIYSYNTTSRSRYSPSSVGAEELAALEDELSFEVEEDSELFEVPSQLLLGVDTLKHRRRHRKAREPLHTSPNSPSRTNRYLTSLNYTQLFVDLPKANERPTEAPVWEIEYTSDEAYGLRDLTVGSYLDLVRRLARDDELFEAFVDRYSVASGAVL